MIRQIFAKPVSYFLGVIVLLGIMVVAILCGSSESVARDVYVDDALRRIERTGADNGTAPEVVMSETRALRDIQETGVFPMHIDSDCDSRFHIVVVRGELNPGAVVPGGLRHPSEPVEFMAFYYAPDSVSLIGGSYSPDGAELRDLLGDDSLPEPELPRTISGIAPDYDLAEEAEIDGDVSVGMVQCQE